MILIVSQINFNAYEETGIFFCFRIYYISILIKYIVMEKYKNFQNIRKRVYVNITIFAYRFQQFTMFNA